MKTTTYKRISLGGILLCLALITAAVLVPVTAFAADTQTTEQDSVHFINPTAITVVGGRLYVADVVEDNKTALLCFDISGEKPVLQYTYDEIDGEVSGLSNDKQNVVYLNIGNKVVELNVEENEPTVGETYAMPIAASDIVDVAFGKIINSEDKTVYALTETALYQYNASSQLFDIELVRTLNDAKSVLSIDEAPNYRLYYIDGTNKPVHRMNLSNGGQDSGFSEKLTLTAGFMPEGMLRLNNDVALYNSDSIYIIEETTSLASTTALLTLSSLYASDCRICDVESYGDRLFILNSKNKIDVFDKTEDVYNKEPTTTIGSDIVDRPTPTSYTSFTLVRPNGYPANIIYKTNAESSIPDIITDASEYIVLGYEGAETSHYYYVLVGDKFGWVKKSDGAATPDKDNKLTVVDNNRSDGTYTQEAKFTSLRGVYVYELPLSDADYEEVTQSASSMKTVKLLQEYKEGDITWYYVSYDGNKTGFVKSSDVGQIHTTAKTENIVSEGLRKINSSLFSAVNLYNTAEMTDGDFAADADGNTIKLYSGDRVTLIETKENASRVMVLRNNGDTDFGWLETSRLIGVHQITTNAIVGLSLLAVAVTLATVLLIIYFKRKKRIKRNSD